MINFAVQKKLYMTIQQYLDLIHKQVKLGNATEHTFRGYLSQLIETIAPQIIATNEPKRQKSRR